MSAAAKQDGFLVTLVPPESYMDASTDAYDRSLRHRYPENWQTLLDRGKQSYRRVKVMEERPALGTFKSQLTSALKLEDDKAKASAISSAGFKQSTWWEDDADGKDVSRDWRK